MDGWMNEYVPLMDEYWEAKSKVLGEKLVGVQTAFTRNLTEISLGVNLGLQFEEQASKPPELLYDTQVNVALQHATSLGSSAHKLQA
jgi:hypothetical protein